MPDISETQSSIVDLQASTGLILNVAVIAKIAFDIYRREQLDVSVLIG
jgi:hypothetical protein